MRHVLVALCLAVLASTMPAHSEVEDAAIIRSVAPPPARYEKVPVPRSGYTWSRGFWDWRGTHDVWMKGEWVLEKPGFRWEAWRWVEEGDRWYFVRGRYAAVKASPAVVAHR